MFREAFLEGYLAKTAARSSIEQQANSPITIDSHFGTNKHAPGSQGDIDFRANQLANKRRLDRYKDSTSNRPTVNSRPTKIDWRQQSNAGLQRSEEIRASRAAKHEADRQDKLRRLKNGPTPTPVAPTPTPVAPTPVEPSPATQQQPIPKATALEPLTAPKPSYNPKKVEKMMQDNSSTRTKKGDNPQGQGKVHVAPNRREAVNKQLAASRKFDRERKARAQKDRNFAALKADNQKRYGSTRAAENKYKRQRGIV